MKTFNEEKKQFWIDTMQAHQDADRLTQGDWWDGEKGCFFGCAMETEDYALNKAIKEMELPAWLVYLSEAIFEGLPEELALTWPVRLLKAVPCDADISEVEHKLAVVRLTGLISDNNSDQVNKAILQVIDYHKNTNRNEAQRSAARSAAMSVQRSAERYSEVYAARSAARSAEWSSERSATWSAESDNLIKILNEYN